MSGNVFWREENMSDDDILWLVEYTAKVQAVAAKQATLAAAREERAAIVAWLRFEYERLLVLSRKRGVDAHTEGQALTAELAADAIERGDHLRGDDE